MTNYHPNGKHIPMKLNCYQTFKKILITEKPFEIAKFWNADELNSLINTALQLKNPFILVLSNSLFSFSAKKASQTARTTFLSYLS